MLGGAVASFIAGMSKALGVTPSLLSIMVLVIGLWLLYLSRPRVYPPLNYCRDDLAGAGVVAAQWPDQLNSAYT